MGGRSSLDFQLGIQKFSLPTSDGLHCEWVFRVQLEGIVGFPFLLLTTGL